jgi:putative methyltransferase (TIGR04325 family)
MDILKKIVNCAPNYLIFDRTQFNVKNENRLTIQRVPPTIYDASYPCWFLNEQEFLRIILKSYKLIWEFKTLDVADIPSNFKGLFFEKL